MSELVAATSGTLSETDQDAKYAAVVGGMHAASERLHGLAEEIDYAFRGVADAADLAVGLADAAAAKRIDAGTTGDYRDAAAMMRGVVGHASRMSGLVAGLAEGFGATANRHAVEYGGVAAAVAAMPVPMADPSVYRTP